MQNYRLLKRDFRRVIVRTEHLRAALAADGAAAPRTRLPTIAVTRTTCRLLPLAVCDEIFRQENGPRISHCFLRFCPDVAEQLCRLMSKKTTVASEFMKTLCDLYMKYHSSNIPRSYSSRGFLRTSSHILSASTRGRGSIDTIFVSR